MDRRGQDTNVHFQRLNAGLVGVNHGRGRDCGGRGGHICPSRGVCAEDMTVVHRWTNLEVARSAHNARKDGLRSTLHPYLDEQVRIVPGDPRPGMENERRGKM